MFIHALSIVSLFLLTYQGSTTYYGHNKSESFYRSITSNAKANNNANNIANRRYSFSPNMFGTILDSAKSNLESEQPVSLTIAMKLQPKRRYRKLRVADSSSGSSEADSPLALASYQVNSVVGSLLKRTGHLTETPKHRSTRKPRYRVSQITVPSLPSTRSQSALAKFEIRRQKAGLQSKKPEPTMFPLSLPSESQAPNRPRNANRKRKVKVSKHDISLVGPLITAPPTDKSKLTIPKPRKSWSSRRKSSGHEKPRKKSMNLANFKYIESRVESKSSSEAFLRPKISSTEKSIVRNLGSHGAVLLASGQLAQTNKSKITRVPLEPLDYEIELGHSDVQQGQGQSKQNLSPFSSYENSNNPTVDESYFTKSPITEKTTSTKTRNSFVSSTESSSQANSKNRYRLNSRPRYTENYQVTNRPSPAKPENRYKWDYGNFGERMVPLKTTDATTSTTTVPSTTSTTTTTEPSTPSESDNIYFDPVTSGQIHDLDQPIEIEADINAIENHETQSTPGPFSDEPVTTSKATTVTQWTWDDNSSLDLAAGNDDGLLVSPAFQSSNEEDESQDAYNHNNYEMYRKLTQPEVSTTTPDQLQQPDEPDYTLPTNFDREASKTENESNRSFFLPFELKYLTELCKNNSASGHTERTAIITTTTTTTTTTPLPPTTYPSEELTLEKSQIEEATLNFGDRPGRYSQMRSNKPRRFNLKKVTYQYKSIEGNDQTSRPNEEEIEEERQIRPIRRPKIDEKSRLTPPIIFTKHATSSNQATPTQPRTRPTEKPIIYEEPTTVWSRVKLDETSTEKSVQPPVRHEYRYIVDDANSYIDNGKHGDPIGLGLYNENDLRATESTDSPDEQKNENEYDDVASYDQDKKIFEAFESDLTNERLKSTKNDDSRNTETESNFTLRPLMISEKDETRKTRNNSDGLGRTLKNMGSFSSSVLDELAGIPGGAGRDYPALTKIPDELGFTCKGRASGFYADMSTRCQVYHHCNHGAMQSFICPNGTIFNQEISVCSWWFNVDCSKSEKLYELNSKPKPTQPPLPPMVKPQMTADSDYEDMRPGSLPSSRPYNQGRSRSNRIIYKQPPELSETFFRETPRAYLSSPSDDYYTRNNRRRHRHYHNSDGSYFSFF